MHSFIAAMTRRFPIDVAGTVGHPAMIGTGPLGGHTVETGLAIASMDPLAADVVGPKLLGFQVQAVRHLWEAGRLGIGEAEIDKMEFPALSLQDAIGAFRTAAYGKPLKVYQERTTTEGLGPVMLRSGCTMDTAGACYLQPAPDGQLRGHIELGP